MLSPRTLKLLAAGYAVKTALIGLVWLIAPELPMEALARLRATWVQVTGEP